MKGIVIYYVECSYGRGYHAGASAQLKDLKSGQLMAKIVKYRLIIDFSMLMGKVFGGFLRPQTNWFKFC